MLDAQHLATLLLREAVAASLAGGLLAGVLISIPASER